MTDMKHMSDTELSQLAEVQEQVSGFGLLEMLRLDPPHYDDVTGQWVFSSLPKMKGVIKM